MKQDCLDLMRRLRTPIALALTAALLVDATLTAAAPFKELSEDELANMRGKFVVGTNIAYFGISVSTQWTHQTALAGREPMNSSAYAPVPFGQGPGVADPQGPGFAHEVKLNLQVDNSGVDTRIAYSVEGTLGSQVPNTPAPAPNPSLSQIGGVVQAIQVAGSDNQVENHIRYAVLPNGTVPAITDAQIATEIPVDQTFVNGDVVTHVTASNGIGVTIFSQGNQITQQLGVNPVTHASQLLQSVELKANGHRIVNDLMLQVAFDNAVAQRDSLRFRADRVMSQL